MNISHTMMTREEAYDFLKKDVTNTQAGQYVHISCALKAIELVAYDDELREKAIDGVYD